MNNYDANLSFYFLVLAVDYWVSKYMDQWEKFKFDTEYGPIYVTISRHDEYPDAFDLVDKEGNIIKQAGLE